MLRSMAVRSAAGNHPALTHPAPATPTTTHNPNQMESSDSWIPHLQQSAEPPAQQGSPVMEQDAEAQLPATSNKAAALFVKGGRGSKSKGYASPAPSSHPHMLTLVAHDS